MDSFPFFLAVASYTGAAGVIIARHLRGISHPSIVSWWLVLLGWLSQGLPLALRLVAEKGFLAVNLTASLELSVWVVGLLYLIGWRLQRQTVRSVGGILLPSIVVFLLASQLLPAVEPQLRALSDPLLLFHLTFSLLAYGLLTLAAILAMLDAVQEYAIKAKRSSRIFFMVPSMDIIETTLFFLVRLGFLLLTVSIISGGFYSHANYGEAFRFNHKVVFVLATWAVFATLLVGRYIQGWRGRRAVRWTLSGYLFLVLSYLGVKFVTEIIL